MYVYMYLHMLHNVKVYIFVSSSIHTYGCVYTYVSIHIRAVWYLCIECNCRTCILYCTALYVVMKY